jgi:hypothetical protein
MARRIQVTGYLTSDELEARYRRAKGGVERSQWQMLWLLSSGKGSAKVAEVTGYCQDWIRKLVQRTTRRASRLSAINGAVMPVDRACSRPNKTPSCEANWNGRR